MRSRVSNLIESVRVGRWGTQALPPLTPDTDPRGILWVWEEPRMGADYVIGVDPTMGRPGWSRNVWREGDDSIDNAAIEVFRKGNRLLGQPDVQVAELAGPYDPQDLAELCNYVGRLYGGRHEDRQALLCIEVYPGPGWLVQRELISRFGYTNLPPWLVEGAGLSQKMTTKLGWISTSASRKELWTRCTSHIFRHGAILRSPALIEEMVDCKQDYFMSMTARAAQGRKDDRVVSAWIALWFCSEWLLGAEASEPTIVEETSAGDYQETAISAGAMKDDWDAKVSQLLDD